MVNDIETNNQLTEEEILLTECRFGVASSVEFSNLLFKFTIYV